MKYWNKDKEVRKLYWHKITYTPPTFKSTSASGHSTVRHVLREDRQCMKRWCQLQPSTGRFYNYQASDNWWFEHEHDAMLFALKFCR